MSSREEIYQAAYAAYRSAEHRDTVMDGVKRAVDAALSSALKQVATVERWNQGGSGEFATATGIEKLPHGTKLYTLEQTNDDAK